LPQAGPREEAEERAEEATVTLGAQRQRKLSQENPVGQARIPRSHSSVPSSFPFPQRGLTETAEEEAEESGAEEAEEPDAMIVSILQR